ncbi:MAG: FAD-dependent thymidylate synthase [Dehalococcoidia bacterium]|jgi:thymidylate synthase ThyX|nr:FAD-dependent thymidylate synthase [Dehalococcoidia bacterium]
MAESGNGSPIYNRRVYPLDAHDLSEEQIAVAFAMTSRRPEPFDEIARQVSEEKAAEFHERWVLGYGHASVAEHAVLHLAVENVSRLACDTLEDNRLASYTEKSSRYQVMPEDYFYSPRELDGQPELARLYNETCRRLFRDYRGLIDGFMEHFRRTTPRGEREGRQTYNMRLRRSATDNCRAVLPSALLTNVGVTANARVLEHAISKLLSSELAEEQELGQDLRQQARGITPTLIKYAEPNPYLAGTAKLQQLLARENLSEIPVGSTENPAESPEPVARLVHWDHHAEEKLAAALLYRQSDQDYDRIWQRVLEMSLEERRDILNQCVAGLGPHDAPVREFELVDYAFEFLMDYGAYREFKRHRMMSYVPQPLTAVHRYRVPDLVAEAGLGGMFEEAVGSAEEAYRAVCRHSPVAAQYLVTHAHYRRVLAKMNLRECYHLFKLRTSELAHFSIRQPVLQAMKLAVEVHPELFRHLRLRDFPGWWPFKRSS